MGHQELLWAAGEKVLGSQGPALSCHLEGKQVWSQLRDRGRRNPKFVGSEDRHTPSSMMSVNCVVGVVILQGQPEASGAAPATAQLRPPGCGAGPTFLFHPTSALTCQGPRSLPTQSTGLFWPPSAFLITTPSSHSFTTTH